MEGELRVRLVRLLPASVGGEESDGQFLPVRHLIEQQDVVDQKRSARRVPGNSLGDEDVRKLDRALCLSAEAELERALRQRLRSVFEIDGEVEHQGILDVVAPARVPAAQVREPGAAATGHGASRERERRQRSHVRFPSWMRGLCPRGTATRFARATRSATFWAMRTSACDSASSG